MALSPVAFLGLGLMVMVAAGKALPSPADFGRFSGTPAIGMLLGLTCGAVVLTWLYNRSGGSILLVAIWHGLYNFVSGTQAATGILAGVVSTLIMIQGLVLIGLDLRARRRGRPSVLGPA